MVQSRQAPGEMCVLLLAGLVVALAFAPALRGGFLLDDLSQLPFAARLKGWEWLGPDAFGMPRPGKNLLFMWLGSVWPRQPFFWHLTALAVHALNVTLLGVVAKRFGFRLRSAVLMALVWGLAPTQVSTVCWASCLNIEVATLWALVFLFCSVGPSDEPLGGLWVVLGLASFAIAVFSYEALAPVALLPWLWRVTRIGWKRAWEVRSLASLAGAGVVVVGLLVWRHMVSPGLGAEILNEQLVGASSGRLSIASGYLLLRHAALWIWPFGQQGVLTSIDLSDQTTLMAVFSSLFLLVMIGLLLVRGWGSRQGRRIVFGLCWFVAAMLPLCNLIPFGNGPIADYYLYFSSMGLALALVAFGERLEARRLTAVGGRVTAAYVLLWGLITWRTMAAVMVPTWAMYWKDEISLLRRTIANDPFAHAARAALAVQLVHAGKLQEAESLAVEARGGNPGLTQAGFALGSVYLQTARPVQAAVVYGGLVREYPRHVGARVMLGFALDEAGDTLRARQAYRAALARPWDFRFSWQAARNLAGSFFTEGQPEEALAVLQDALEKAPDEGRLHQTAAVLALELGQPALAGRHARLAERYGFALDPAMAARIDAAMKDTER